MWWILSVFKVMGIPFAINIQILHVVSSVDHWSQCYSITGITHLEIGYTALTT